MTRYYQDQQKAMQHMETLAKQCIKTNTEIDIEVLGFEILKKFPVSAKFVRDYMSVLERQHPELLELTVWPL